MGPHTVLQALALLFLAMTVNAEPQFKSVGKVKDFDGVVIDSGTKGTVKDTTSVRFRRDGALEMTQTHLSNGYIGRYHSEVFKKDGYRPGESKFYGFAFRLADDWDLVSKQSFDISQFIADFTKDSSKCDGWMPSTMLWLVGDQLKTRAKSGDLCNQKTTSFNVAKVKAGVWHRVVLEATWQSSATGVLRMWFDGNLALDKTGLATTIKDSAKTQFQFRIGLYANGWHDDKKMVGSQKMRKVFFSEVAIGSTREDVDPGKALVARAFDV